MAFKSSWSLMNGQLAQTLTLFKNIERGNACSGVMQILKDSMENVNGITTYQLSLQLRSTFAHWKS